MLSKYEEKLELIRGQVIDVMNGIISANEKIYDALKDCDKDTFDGAKQFIKNVALKTNDIDKEIVTTLALHTPEAKDLRELIAFLKITNELLRASSSTRNFISGFSDVCFQTDIKAINEFALPMQRSTIESLKYAAKMLKIDCVDEAQENFQNALISENKTDDLYEILEAHLLKGFSNDEGYVKYHTMLSVLRRSEKIADRALSIASLLLYARQGGALHN